MSSQFAFFSTVLKICGRTFCANTLEIDHKRIITIPINSEDPKEQELCRCIQLKIQGGEAIEAVINYQSVTINASGVSFSFDSDLQRIVSCSLMISL